MGKAIFYSIPLLILLILVILLASRRPVGDYTDPEGPVYSGQYGNRVGEPNGELKVVSWNVHHAEKLQQVIATLESVEVLQDADVLLLQEVNLSGVEEISQRLRYNYVYYPAAFHRRLKIEFGNAILSKWPMSDKAKIVLPNWLSGWLETRNAAKATITIGHTDIQVYSTHLDVVWMMPVWTQTQGDFLTDMLGAERRFAIIGGDFNTWTKSSIRALEIGFEQYGLVRLTKGTGYTFASSGLRLTLDHIFSENNLDFQSGVYRQTDASDHFPVWADITIVNSK